MLQLSGALPSLDNQARCVHGASGAHQHHRGRLAVPRVASPSCESSSHLCSASAAHRRRVPNLTFDGVAPGACDRRENRVGPKPEEPSSCAGPRPGRAFSGFVTPPNTKSSRLPHSFPIHVIGGRPVLTTPQSYKFVLVAVPWTLRSSWWPPTISLEPVSMSLAELVLRRARGGFDVLQSARSARVEDVRLSSSDWEVLRSARSGAPQPRQSRRPGKTSREAARKTAARSCRGRARRKRRRKRF